MLSDLLEQIKALVNERASAAVIERHLALVRAQHEQAQNRCAVLQAQCQQLQAQLAQAQQRLQAYEHHNPNGQRCHQCGSANVRLVGKRPSKVGAELGAHDDVVACQACGATSVCTVNDPF